ncbi:MAG: hypothetical protein HY047_07350 [Acidobacteria bacterium]|nr:hypothetical protein [Acidobacteriota bacterium]
MQPLDFEFLKDRYDFELARKDKLTDSLNLPIGILTVVGGLLGVMVSGFSYQILWLSKIFVTLLAFDGAAFAISLLFLAFAFHRQTYGYLQFLGEFRDAERMLEDYDQATAGARFEQYLRDSLIEAADMNAKMNIRRGRYLSLGRLAILAMVILTALLGLPYVYDHLKVAPKIPVVHIDNLDGRGR